jgi:hypothetical protein
MDISNITALSCTPSITQSSSIEQTTIQQITSAENLELVTELQNAIDNTANSQASATSSFFTTSSSESYSLAQIKSIMHNIVEKNVTVSTVNSIISSVYNTQDQKVSNVLMDPCGYSLWVNNLKMAIPDSVIKKCDTSQPCVISQTSAIKTVSTQIANMVTAAMSNDAILSKLKQSVTQDTKAKDKGLFDSIDSTTGIVLIICSITIIFII